MKRKTWIVICLVVVLACGVALAAGAQAKKAEKKMDLGGQKLGLIFNATSLLGTVSESSDTELFGLGLKYWLGEKAALRALLEFDFNNDGAGTSTTLFGLSGAFEYHLVKGKVSPYTGGIAGIEIDAQTGAATNLAFFLGGLLGVEVRLLDYLGLFAEYNLRLTFAEPQVDIELGLGNAGQIGVIVYLP
jgi:hypothetical protein